MITKEEYINYANSAYSIVPLTREIDNAGDSPISLYLKVSAPVSYTHLRAHETS